MADRRAIVVIEENDITTVVNPSAIVEGNIVAGPDSAIDGHMAVFDGTSGAVIKDGGAPGGGGSFLSANIARVDPSGDDGTGTVGDLNKPFLTVQAAIDAFVDATAAFGIVDIGANSFQGEDLTIGDAIDIEFRGITRNEMGSTVPSWAFNSLTLTAAATIALSDCGAGDITTSEDLIVLLNNATVSSVISTQEGGSLTVVSIGNNGETTSIEGGNVATLTVAGCRPSATGTDTISLDAENGATINIRNCGQQSGYTGCYDIDAVLADVTVENSLLNDITCQSATFKDSRALGSIAVDNGIVYQDVFLKGVPPGGTTGQALEKASNDDFDTEWASLI